MDVCQLFRQALKDFEGKEITGQPAWVGCEVNRAIVYHSGDPTYYEVTDLDDMKKTYIQVTIKANRNKEWGMNEVAMHRAQFEPSQYIEGFEFKSVILDLYLRRT